MRSLCAFVTGKCRSDEIRKKEAKKMTVSTFKETCGMTLQTCSRSACFILYQFWHETSSLLTFLYIFITFHEFNNLFYRDTIVFTSRITHYFQTVFADTVIYKVPSSIYTLCYCGSPLYGSLLLWAMCDISSCVDVAVGVSMPPLGSAFRQSVAVSLFLNTLHRNT